MKNPWRGVQKKDNVIFCVKVPSSLKIQIMSELISCIDFGFDLENFFAVKISRELTYPVNMSELTKYMEILFFE